MQPNLQAKVSATVRLFGGDSSHTPFFYWQSFQENTLYPLAIIHMEHINVLGFDDKSEWNLCFSFGNLGIIFNGASAQLFFAQGEMVIRLGQRSPTRHTFPLTSQNPDWLFNNIIMRLIFKTVVCVVCFALFLYKCAILLRSLTLYMQIYLRFYGRRSTCRISVKGKIAELTRKGFTRNFR